MIIAKGLRLAAKHGRLVLVLGLIAGITLPGLASLVREFLPELVAALLFTNAFKIGARAAYSGLSSLRETVIVALAFQLALPCIVILIASFAGWSGPLVTAVIIMSAASAISGSPNLVQLSGKDPAPALRLLIIGTAMLPATTLGVLSMYPELGDFDVILGVVIKLALVIFVAAGLGFLIRTLWFSNMTSEQLESVDGFSVILMAILVVGLMSALAPSMITSPAYTSFVLIVAFAVNFGLQLLAYGVLSARHFEHSRVSYSVVAGNRNMALFLTALPAATIDPILLFIACYQIPMYLTPLAFGKLYR